MAEFCASNFQSVFDEADIDLCVCGVLGKIRVARSSSQLLRAIGL